MIIKEIPVEIELPPPKMERSRGVHVSNIIRSIAVDHGILKAEQAEELELTDVREITDPVARLKINIGLAWEEHYIPMLRDVADHPGEMELEGIYMTHDGESISSILVELGRDGLYLIVHEVKATYYSTRTVGDLDGRWMWLAQMKSYCKGLGARHAMMHVLFLCGDYSYPIQPCLKQWIIEFTQEEIDENWDLLRDYKNYKLAGRQMRLCESKS